MELFRRNAAIEKAPLQHEAILFHPGQNRFCVLNRTSSFIWELLERPASPEEIARALTSSFSDVSESQALDDVRQALSDLKALDLVSPVTPTATP